MLVYSVPTTSHNMAIYGHINLTGIRQMVPLRLDALDGPGPVTVLQPINLQV